MAIPNLDEIRRPALELLAERGKLTKISDVFDLLAPAFALTDEDCEEMLPSGTQRKWNNRVNWSCYDLSRAKLLNRPNKGFYEITDVGREFLKSYPGEITRKDLSSFSKEFEKFVTPGTSGGGTGPGQIQPPPPVTPDEQIDTAVAEIDANLRSDLLTNLKEVNPYRFEQVVIDLLFAMGYGGSRAEAAKVTKKTNDEGIDGIINEDRLGLDVIYVQAKRWQSVVGRREIQSFVGALAGQQATKGVFITTSGFTQNAVDFARNVSQKVILIDGDRLADLMIEHDVGVSNVRNIAIKRIDTDYFEEN